MVVVGSRRGLGSGPQSSPVRPHGALTTRRRILDDFDQRDLSRIREKKVGLYHVLFLLESDFVSIVGAILQ